MNQINHTILDDAMTMAGEANIARAFTVLVFGCGHDPVDVAEELREARTL